MRTRNGMSFIIDPKSDNSWSTLTYTSTGDGQAQIKLGAADSTDIMEYVLYKFQDYPPEFQTLILSYSIRFLTDNGYTIRKAGC